jgi:hypothetical protein
MATTNRYIALADHAHKEEAETLNHTGQFHEEEVFEDSEIEPPPSGPDGGEGKINISVGAANGQTSGGNDIFADPQEMDQPQQATTAGERRCISQLMTMEKLSTWTRKTEIADVKSLQATSRRGQNQTV